MAAAHRTASKQCFVIKMWLEETVHSRKYFNVKREFLIKHINLLYSASSGASPNLKYSMRSDSGRGARNVSLYFYFGKKIVNSAATGEAYLVIMTDFYGTDNM